MTPALFTDWRVLLEGDELKNSDAYHIMIHWALAGRMILAEEMK
jgi:hypothetical protein